MEIGHIYAIIAGTSILQIFLIYNRSIHTKYKETIDAPFCHLLVYFLLFCFVDMWWGICDSRPSFINNIFFNVVTYAYHTLCAFSAFFWFGYILRYVNLENKKKLHAYNIMRCILILWQLSMIVANLFTRSSFYVDKEMNYHIGALRFPMYLAQFFYYIVILISSIVTMITKKENRRIQWNVFVFSSIPLVFGIGQYVFYDVAMYSIGFTISAFVIYAFNLNDIREKHLENLAEEEKYFANIDVLTKLLNRKGYEENLLIFPKIPPEEDFVYVSLDLNELKKINDAYGHNAGDEVIKGISDIMKRCMEGYGRLFRIGGDEFAAIIFANQSKLEEIKKDFNEAVLNWKGKTVANMYVSVGYVTKREFPDKTVEELAAIADERMYKEKAKFYTTKGIDRRGQAEAFNALCRLYKKILRVNLTEDSYHIITMDINEKNERDGFSEKLSTWIHAFGFSGYIHKDDLDFYLEKTDINYLKEYFAKGNSTICIPYRRLSDGIYHKAIMELTPARDYTNDWQSLYLYVKIID